MTAECFGCNLFFVVPVPEPSDDGLPNHPHHPTPLLCLNRVVVVGTMRAAESNVIQLIWETVWLRARCPHEPETRYEGDEPKELRTRITSGEYGMACP